MPHRRTIVIQSHDPNKMQPWICRCLQSVREWATSQGFAYIFLGNELFEGLPFIDSKRVEGLLPITDYARLIRLREVLNTTNWDRALWIDADVLIFRPETLTVTHKDSFAFCKELWIETNSSGLVEIYKSVNNCFMHFDLNCPMLNFYIDICYRTFVKSSSQVSKCQLGPDFLEQLYQTTPLPLHEKVTLISPSLAQDILEKSKSKALNVHNALWFEEVCAANLCNSLLSLSNLSMECLVDELLVTQGECLNLQVPIEHVYGQYYHQTLKIPNATPWLLDSVT